MHRIGRTGRSGKTGIATTFINKGCGKTRLKYSCVVMHVIVLWCNDHPQNSICCIPEICMNSNRNAHEGLDLVCGKWPYSCIEWNSTLCFFYADESVLMDLKALLIEAKQKVPPVLQILQTGDETMLDIGGKTRLQWGNCTDVNIVCFVWFMSECPSQ